MAISPLVATTLVVLGLLVYSGPAPIENVFLGAMVIAFHVVAGSASLSLLIFFVVMGLNGSAVDDL